MELIYKYFPETVMELIFSKKNFCGVKCSYPKDYNDPFELFLGVDLTIGPEGLAVYSEIVQDIPQFPTTCFSSSPVVTPMWAHYAQNHSGFVVEFDFEKLKSYFPDAGVRNVTYRDEPDSGIKEMIERAAVTMKPRHAVWLRDAVLSQSYFSKHTAWTYESEVRLVTTEQHIEDVSGSMILHIPIDCVKSLIIGKNSGKEAIKLSKEICKNYQIRWLQEIIGKSHPAPFFKDEDDAVFSFEDNNIAAVLNKCSECHEPVSADKEFCPWCSITDDNRFVAARNNPLRLLDHIGHLEGYLRGVEAIKKGLR